MKWNAIKIKFFTKKHSNRFQFIEKRRALSELKFKSETQIHKKLECKKRFMNDKSPRNRPIE